MRKTYLAVAIGLGLGLLLLCGVKISAQAQGAALAAKIAWERSAFSELSAYDQVVSMPAVADIDPGSGGRAIPEIIFSSYQGQNYDADGVLRVLRGDDGSEVFSVTDAELRVRPLSSPLVVDLENDGAPEIVVEASAGGLFAFDNGAQGPSTLKYTSAPTFTLHSAQGSAPIAADLDGDGVPEIVVGRYVLDHTLSHTSILGAGDDTLLISLVGDVNLDGSQEVVAANRVYSGTGGVLFYNPALPAQATNALANFDADPYAEIVLVAPFNGGQVYLLEHTLAVIWGPVSMPGGGATNGGPPTVADFDGDGQPEIGVAGAHFYVIFEGNGTILMQRPSQDVSSGFSVAAAFDFDRNGAAEVVYADEHAFYIHAVLQASASFSTTHSTVTGYEIPVVADIDGDFEAEVVVVANDAFCPIYGCTPGLKGVRAFESAGPRWANARRVWHQHAYDITSIDDRLQVISNPVPVWQTHNTLRGQISPSFETLFLPIILR